MRIAIATDAWHPQINGVVTTLTHTIAELRRLGHQVHIISPEEFTTVPCPTYPEIRLALLPGRKLRQQLRTFSAEAIHIATEGPMGLAARRYCLRQRLPFTTSLHTRFPEYLHLRSGSPVSWGYRYLRWFHGPARCTMVAGDSLRRELSTWGLKHLAIWSRGVDVDLFCPQRRVALAGEKPVFMYVGRVAVEKNIEAFLALDLPGTKYIVGDGPDLDTLKTRYPGVRFTGYKTGRDLAECLAGADVFVFPSKTDTFGLVILEALASGVPVAAYPVQGPKDLIRKGVSGYLDEDLRQAAIDCLSLTRSSCREVALGFSWTQCANQFLAHLATS